MSRDVVNHFAYGFELGGAFELESELVLNGEAEQQDGEGIKTDIADEL